MVTPKENPNPAEIARMLTKPLQIAAACGLTEAIAPETRNVSNPSKYHDFNTLTPPSIRLLNHI